MCILYMHDAERRMFCMHSSVCLQRCTLILFLPLYASAGMGAGFGAEDSYGVYDKALFADRTAAGGLYRCVECRG
jgi:hypothetical protein